MKESEKQEPILIYIFLHRICFFGKVIFLFESLYLYYEIKVITPTAIFSLEKRFYAASLSLLTTKLHFATEKGVTDGAARIKKKKVFL